MKVNGEAARVMIEYLKSYVKEGGYTPVGQSAKQLEVAFRDKAFLEWTNAYAEFRESFDKQLKNILQDLSSPREDSFESIWQKGLLSVANRDKLLTLDSRLMKALALPYQESVDLALKYLPKQTKIDVDVYVTVDPFNTGMMRPGKVFISILLAEPSVELARGFAHEFHHAGACYWLDKNPQLKALKSSNEHASMLAEMIVYLVTEGLANWYTSASTHIVEGEEEQNRMVRKLEGKIPDLLKELEHLLFSLCDRQPIAKVKRDFQALTLNLSGNGAPIGHFLSGRMVGAMDNSNDAPKEKIVDLVKHPFEFLDLYNEAVTKNKRLNASLMKSIRKRIHDWT